MTIAIASDHAGYELKELIKDSIDKELHQVIDCGVDEGYMKVSHYPYAKKLCLSIVKEEADLGILICGTGVGMSMAANRYEGIRAALVSDTYTAIKSKQHNHCNVLCLGSRVLGVELAKTIADVWIDAKPLKEYEVNALAIDDGIGVV